MFSQARAALRAAVLERHALITKTLQPYWFLLPIFAILAVINGIGVYAWDAEILWVFPMLSIALIWFCWSDFQEKKARFGGKGFFGVLRAQEAHQEKVREARRQARVGGRETVEDKIARARKAAMAAGAIGQILRVDGEPRAFKVAKKAQKTGEHAWALGLISDNAEGEPRSAKIARDVLTSR